ncbi:MAG: homoserine dehydrogenase [Acidobacteriota bacterium]|nr:homoserine dehydrogenase [Acidobacteriota bacterium]
MGQAVARAAAAGPLVEQGIAITIEGALVRDVSKPRRAPGVARVTSNVEAFLRGRYDVVIDALAGCDPAASIVGRVLGKGVPVVSANKSLIAAEGERLRAIAARAGATFRIEASVMAGVPFLGMLERRPFAGRVTRLTGVVNGTSQFIVTRLAAGASIDDAIADAQRLGYAEPDPRGDVSGRDALDKLVILADVLLGAALPAASIPLEGLDDVTPQDLDAAVRLGGALKPLVFAARAPHGIAAFVAPAWIPVSHPLAAFSGRDNAIVIEGRHIDRLVFAGPGAGPDITAATLLDDAVEAAQSARLPPPLAPRPRSDAKPVVEAETGWLVRVTHARATTAAFAALQFEAVGLAPRVVDGDARSWLLLPVAPAARVTAIAETLRAQGTSIKTWRALHD